ncbi:MAG: serine/threonine-protein kinase [Phycisphaerales bacterium]|nr:serine/threonine protein kinase [Planctomycetota bacterium]
MPDHDGDQIYRFFHRARDQAPAEREAWLRRQGLSEAVVVEVLQLLAGAARESVLRPVETGALPPRVGGGLGVPPIPEKIGPYRVISKLGEGGLGVVYLAERREPMVQRVALKVVKPGSDSAAALARFDQERQALAIMAHPNIATILDGGQTEGGSPYFVMEYVQGAPITRYCDEKRLTIRERLELFMSVCDAVQHAHHKGVIHRDLKPSNILVTEVDRRPVAKVIDFGIAKAMGPGLGSQTMYTEAGLFVGTPEYMSPEQAGVGAFDVDTRADVYSLGVVLYELLVGVLPFDSQSLRAEGIAGLQKIIRESDAPRPSTRLRMAPADRVTLIAECRREAPDHLRSELGRELEWIPLMAIRKDRNERYASARELAEDIGNYLEGRPLIAGPESAAYRARKFLRRHKAGVIASSIVLLSILLGIGATVRSLLIRAADLDRTRQALRASAELIDALSDETADDAKFENSLNKAAALIESGENWPDLDSAADIAMGCAHAYNNRGRHPDALRLAKRGLELRQRLYGDDHVVTLDARQNVALYMFLAGRMNESLEVLRKLLADDIRVLGEDEDRTLNCRQTLIGCLIGLNRIEEADKEVQALLAAGQRRGPAARDYLVDAQLLRCEILVRQHKLAEAIALADRTIAEEELANGPNSRAALGARRVRGVMALEARDYAQAVAILIPTLEAMNEAFSARDPYVILCTAVSIDSLAQNGQLEEAVKLAERQLRRLRQQLGVQSPAIQELAKRLRELLGDKPPTPEQARLLSGIS